MSSFRYWLVGFTFVSAVVPLACAGILGDFASTASNDGGASADGGGNPPTDGSMPMTGHDGGAGPDAPATTTDGGSGISDAQPTPDAPVTLSPLTCLNPQGQPNWQGNPQLLYTVPDAGSSGNNGSPVNNLYVEHLGNQNAARVIAQINVPQTNLAIFTAPEQGGQLQTSLLDSIGLRGELKVPGAVTLLIQPFSQNNDLVLYEIPDTDPGTTLDAGTGVASIAPPPDQAPNNGDFRLSFVQTPGDNYFTVAAYESTTANQYDLASWNSPKTWGTIPWDGTEMYVDSPMILNGVEAYDFIGPPGGGGGGGPSPLSQYTFSLQNPSVSAPRLITSASGQAATIAIAPTVATAPATGYTLAFVELTGAQSADIRAGIVAPGAIKTFVLSDLAPLDFKAAGDASFFDTTPFGGNGGVGARWMSNGDLGIMGAGGVGQGTSGSTGVNFYVAAPTSADTIQWIIQTAGTGSNLFPGQSIGTIAFDVSQSTNDLVMTFDVAWAQPQPDGTTAIFFNILKCSI